MMCAITIKAAHQKQANDITVKLIRNIIVIELYNDQLDIS